MDKAGLDYFYFPCRLGYDVKFIEQEFGHEGFSIYVKLLQYIYGHEGYYLDFENDCLDLYCFEFNIDKDTLKKIVKTCLNQKIFDIQKFNEFKILTSETIQLSYMHVARSREYFNLNMDYLTDFARAQYNKNLEMRDCERIKREFKNATGKYVADVTFIPPNIDMELLTEKVLESEFLMNQNNFTLKVCIKHYDKIINDCYWNC